MFIAKIPDKAYSSGVKYYGAGVTCAVDTKTKYDYQCMICAIDETTYDRIVYNYY